MNIEHGVLSRSMVDGGVGELVVGEMAVGLVSMMLKLTDIRDSDDESVKFIRTESFNWKFDLQRPYHYLTNKNNQKDLTTM